MGSAADSQRARQALLQAACDVFAEMGYRKATVREISRRAEQNLSAINYHFGSKEELYRQVLRLAGPPEGADPQTLGRGLSPRQRLRAFLAFFLAETLGDDGQPWKAQIMLRELSSPTGMLDDLVRNAIRPHFDALRATVAELLLPVGNEALDGPPPFEELPPELQERVHDHAFSTVAQVIFYRQSRPVLERLAGRRYGAGDRERLAEHVFRAVTSAIAADRRRLRDELRPLGAVGKEGVA